MSSIYCRNAGNCNIFQGAIYTVESRIIGMIEIVIPEFFNLFATHPSLLINSSTSLWREGNLHKEGANHIIAISHFGCNLQIPRRVIQVKLARGISTSWSCEAPVLEAVAIEYTPNSRPLLEPHLVCGQSEGTECVFLKYRTHAQRTVEATNATRSYCAIVASLSRNLIFQLLLDRRFTFRL